MLRRFIAIVALIAVLGIPAIASSQDFGNSGTLAFSAERMFGFSVGERNFELGNDRERDIGFTLFGLGWQSETGFSPPFNLTRLGIDYWVIDGLSVGGTFGFFAGEIDDDNDDDNDDGFGILFAPRVGYFFSFASWVGLWLRGGITFYTIDDVPFDQDQLLLNFEAAFVFFPADSWGFLVAPTADIGLFGEAGDNDMQEWAIGLQLGMLGYLNL